MSLACARCHDHKFDPIRHENFYQLSACFANIPESGKGNDNDFGPRLTVESPLQAPAREQAATGLATVEQRLSDMRSDQRQWESEVGARLPLPWTPLTPQEATAVDSTLQVLSDQTVLAAGLTPDSSIYELVFETGRAAAGHLRGQLARRLAERDVRFIQLDARSSRRAAPTRTTGATITVDALPGGSRGAGGGVRPGTSYGTTDDFGYNVAENPVSTWDLNATILHLFGIDHERLTYRSQGRAFRLTDVYGRVTSEIVA